MNHLLQLDLSREHAEVLRAQAQRNREARAARPERPARPWLQALLSALHLRPRMTRLRLHRVPLPPQRGGGILR